MPLRINVRRLVPGAVAIALILALFFVAREPTASAGETRKLVGDYKFTEMAIAMPPGYRPRQTLRKVNPAYQHIRSWISSVGAGIALTDLTGHGRDDGMCIVDTRTDEAVVTYTPTAPQADRFTPFALDARPLPIDSTMAPMGCVPGDFNGDARTDLLVYYWGRTPIAFLARSTATSPSAAAYRPVELVPQASTNGRYSGPQWNSNAVAVADFDGDGRPDVFVGNYFPISDVLNPHGIDNVQMNASMSNARNAGGDFVLRWIGGTSGPNPTVRFEQVPNAIPYAESTGWTLAAATADLTGNGLPELYIANDFGPDHLLYNASTPGHVRFTATTGKRTATTPKSFVLGKDSFKGMGVDFGDIGNHGMFDIAVGNITTAWGLEESNFLFMNQTHSRAEMQRALASGVAPFTQEAEELGMARTGWVWDTKTGDFSNSGRLDVVQADGFVKGAIDRWPWLQEMAMTNDDLYSNPSTWPLVEPGDDIAGHQCLAFYTRGNGDRYVNISKPAGLCVPTPTRGVATADTRTDGALDLAVARQWGPPAFYANQSPHLGNYLGLRLYRPAIGGTATGMAGIGSPAYGATVQISRPGASPQIGQLDGGSGHSGKRSFEVRFGLGSYDGPVSVHLQWRDLNWVLRTQNLQLTPGTHSLLLTSDAKEVASR